MPTRSVGSSTPSQASSTHMGELRNVETHMQLYYPSTFHALGSGARSGHRRRAHDGVHPEFARRGGLAVPGQRRGADVESAPVGSTPGSGQHPVAYRRSGRHRRRAVGVVHRGALRRVRRGRAAQPGGLRPGRTDDGAHHELPAAPRPDSAGDPGAARRVLDPHHRRRGRGDVRGRVVAVRCPVAPGARPAGRLRDPADRRRADAAGAAATVPRGVAAGRDHRRTRVRHPPGQEARAVRRDRAAHPPPQRLSDPEHPHRAGCRGRTDSVDQARLVAGGGLAAAGDRDRAFVGAVRRTGRHRHRQVQRPVLQRPAPALGGRHHADHPDGRDRIVHGGGAGGGGCPVADPPGGRPRSRPRFLDRGDGRRCWSPSASGWPGTTSRGTGI